MPTVLMAFALSFSAVFVWVGFSLKQGEAPVFWAKSFLQSLGHRRTPMTSVSVQKESLRRELRRQRALIDPAGAALAARGLVPHALGFFPVDIGPGTVVAGYWPMGGEIDPRPLMEALAGRGVTLALPVVNGPSSCLVFRRWSVGEDLDHGPHQTRHPCPTCDALSPDVLLVPLVGFDDQGVRLGQGGGYYDRTISQLATDRQGRGPSTLGLAFQCQKVDLLPRDPHDCPLDAVATEVGLFRYTRP